MTGVGTPIAVNKSRLTGTTQPQSAVLQFRCALI
jgi:hypothetical protein